MLGKINFKRFLMLLCCFSLVLSFCAVNAFADIIIDNSNPGTSYTGTWSVSGGTLPYGSNSLWSRDGTTYTWQMTSQPAGIYEVLMWWSGWSSRATSVPVRITHSTGQASLTINQLQNAGQWNSLGQYHFDSSGSVTITAAYGATLSTCADAVWFRFISGNVPPTATIDSITPSPAEPGQVVTFTGHGTDSDGTVSGYQWESDIDGVLSTEASFTTSSLSEATHTISFKVQDDEGDWSEAATQLLTVGTIPSEIIIDNRDASTSRTGTWGVSGSAGFYGVDSVWSRDGTIFRWHFTPPRTGVYQVSMWWTEWSSRATAIPVSIAYEGGSQTVSINQQQNGAQWNVLAEQPFSAGVTYLVTITSQAYPTSTCADAVKFNLVQTNDPPVAYIDAITPNPADIGVSVFFSGHGEDGDGSVTAWQWISDIDGLLSSEASFSTTTLSEGTHQISFMVQDDQGDWSAPVMDTLVIGNMSPEAFIDSVTPNPAEMEDDIVFTGHGEDSDGTVSAYHWESNLFGVICDQATCTRSALALGQGMHTITFSVMDSGGKWSDPVTLTLTIGNLSPTAVIESITPNPANLSQAVTFTGHGIDTDGSITGYSWHSSIDGNLSNAASFTTSELSLGNHTITFTVTDNDGASSSPVTAEITVADLPVELIIDNGQAGTSYTGTWYVSGGTGFYGTNALWSRNGPTYIWSFNLPASGPYEVFMWWSAYSSRGDNIPVDITYAGGATKRVYINQRVNGGQWNSLGEYSFGTSGIVTITAATGTTVSTCADAVKFVKVSQPSAPLADFSADRVSGGAPLTVHFTDKSLGFVNSWLWSFGDGGSSSAENPSHTYASPGVYTVSLTATNSVGSNTKTMENYITIVSNSEHIYLCDGYAHDGLFISRATRHLADLGAVNDNGVWVYTNSAKNVTYFIHTVKTPQAMEQALKEEGAHIIFNGHANFGFGATFATAAEVGAQQIDTIYYIDDDRFTNFSSDMVSVKVDGMKYGQAYPNWEPIFKDGSSGIMPYTFSEGLPPYNYYLTYQVPGDPMVYRIELANGRNLERFPDASTPAWYSPDGSPPDPVANLEYYITNNDPDFNRFDFTGNWSIGRVPGAGYMGDAGYLGYNYHYTAAGTGEKTATWTLLVYYPGVYAALASWFPDPANATNATFTVQHAAGSSEVTVDQRTTALVNLLGVYYYTPGIYTIQLDNAADGRVIADAVVLNPLANPEKILQAEFRTNVTSGASPLAVQFVDLSGFYAPSDLTGSITERHWNFGDGATSTDKDPTHTYSTPGIYTVSLRIVDNSGAESTEVKTDFIVVGTEPLLKAEFTSANRLGSDRTVVTFMDQSSGNITGWLWDFGDGGSSTDQNPSHVYTVPGTYTVSLTITGSGESDTETEEAFVYNIIGLVYADNTFQHKPHFYSRSTGSPITFGKVICDTRSVKIPQEELRYSRMFYGSCNSCSYYAGTFNRGVLFCTTGDSEVYTAITYLDNYLLGDTDEQLLVRLNAVQPIHECLNFNLPPPSMR